MNYSVEQLNKDIRKVNKDELEPIRIDRGNRYGSEEDTLFNVRQADFIEYNGWRGAYGSSVECANRQRNYAKIPMSGFTGEMIADFENACLDKINYDYYILLTFRQKLKEYRNKLTICTCDVQPKIKSAEEMGL